jgi:hypothetical protein
MISDQTKTIAHNLRLFGVHGGFEKRAAQAASQGLNHLEFLRLDVGRLKVLCEENGQSRALGYYADVANEFRQNEKLAELAKNVFRPDFEEEMFFKHLDRSETFLKLESLTVNPVAKKWKFLNTDNLHHHLERYEKWLKNELKKGFL